MFLKDSSFTRKRDAEFEYEEGEIMDSEDEQLPGTSVKTYARHQRKKRGTAFHRMEKQKAEEAEKNEATRARLEKEALDKQKKMEDEKKEDEIRARMLKLFTGAEVKIHRVQKKVELLQQLEEQETLNKGPLRYKGLPEELKCQMTKIWEPGLHVGMDGEEIVFIIRIRCPFSYDIY
ncbi:hypothetical protein DFP72DRAFT_194388 [Ephemerocybe angulata]|uniref:Uncharacterized protein n=1 Tax=Ephemerocybe angulata TaxID=980116 RepID=A0A8H6I6K5_9AGAR|nr:hypothetical protein DFP72DRAFT_194388 [Tulosesus angulatus]